LQLSKPNDDAINVESLTGGASVTGLDRIVEEGRRAREEHVRPGEKFTKLPAVAEANVLAYKAGWNYGETTGKVTA
jgi:Pyruvate/2-oxoacid:ferredoxin oxidoreductase gamma subunit